MLLTEDQAIVIMTTIKDLPSTTQPLASSSLMMSVAATAAVMMASTVSTGPIESLRDSEGSGECQLLGPFSLLVQSALGLLALSSLVWKRYRERPRRPIKVWAFDASKQVVGSMLLHIANLLMSMLSAGQLSVKAKALDDDGYQPNPCSFYLLNLAIDVSAASF